MGFFSFSNCLELFFMTINQRYIQRCFDISRLGVITGVSPNPSVGAVIVDAQDRIIGEGWTSPFGGFHAEVNAVNSVKLEDQHLLSSSKIYVSLEPCAHFGKTPPCVDLILARKIPHVIIAYTDPNPKVAGKSIAKLKQQGVKVDILTPKYTNKDVTLQLFFKNISSKRPFIILKWAETANGYIGKPNETVAISNVYAKRLVHKWRAEADAIMVGSNTAALDNPELTTRYYYGKSPMRVVLDRTRRLPTHLHIFDNSVKTVIYTDGISRDNREGGASIDEMETNIYRPIPFDDNLLNRVLEDLYSQNIGILLVEGGAQLLNAFIQKGLWDEARVFKSASTMIHEGGISAPTIPTERLEQKMQLFDNQLFIFRNA
jgi:diaminohydroxyphosphoribosylaminopyrimidine deaminase / 5-amino-6-(5-phosphoribosylamino)uracil reductase